jgi:hypothetical protein
MKKLNFIALVFIIVLSSCADAGTLKEIDKGGNQDIEVFKYYYDTGEYVYISRFKDNPNVVTTTWSEQHGKQVVTEGNIAIYKNTNNMKLYIYEKGSDPSIGPILIFAENQEDAEEILMDSEDYRPRGQWTEVKVEKGIVTY